MKTHATERPFTCDICHTIFKQKYQPIYPVTRIKRTRITRDYNKNITYYETFSVSKNEDKVANSKVVTHKLAYYIVSFREMRTCNARN